MWSWNTSVSVGHLYAWRREMKHKSLLVYVPCLDGGCEDVGRIELAGHTLVSDERLWDLEAAEKHANELEERCVKWEAVFGHLGDTPDDCGNAIIAARDELEERCDELSADKGTWYRMSEVFSKRITEVETALKTSEERCATLTDALRSTAQTLAWIQHGECRGFSDDLLATNEALDKARAALEKSK